MTTTLDFNALIAGTVVENQFSADGVTVSATGGSGDAMIFDTSHPTGGDTDLATSNLGKVLIISEDGDSNDPDDNGSGGTFTFAFDNATTVHSLTFLDIEETATITLLDENNVEIGTINVGATGNNGQTVAHINTAGVARMDVTLHGSGAVDNLVFDMAGPADEAGPDYIVEGTSAGELIDAGYDQDPEGDMIDALDDGGTPASNDDSVRAGAGDDTVRSGDGDDTVSGGSGNDFLLGDDNNAQAGDDLLMGDDGDDTLCGFDGDDTLDGGAGDDLLEGMEGADLLLGGSGNDLAFGDNGDDTIFGDAGTQDDGSVREVFQWDLAPNTGASDFSQDTGNVTVSFSEIDGGASDNISTDTQLVAGIDTTDAPSADATSSLDSVTNGQGNSDTYVLGFSDAVDNVSFRVNDIDGDGVVKIEAFDAAGNPIEVQLSGGSELTLLDTDGVAGVDTADSNGGYMADTAPEYSLLVTIPGPVSEIRILHSQDGSGNSGINVTDVYFDVPNAVAAEGAGDDTLNGGAGDDLVYGNEGDDLISGNSGDDVLYGDDPAEGTPVSGNLIFNGSFEITSGMETTGYGFKGDGNVPGWSDANGNEIDFHNDGRGGVNPTDGDNWLDLESSPGNARVGQTVDGVQDGETYLLTFDAGDKSDEPQSGAGENLIEVYWGGELVGTVDPAAGQMNEFSFELTGGAGDGTNKLEFVGLGDEDNFGASIDDVSLVQLAGEPGEGGNDTISGGTGDDEVYGQDGDDRLAGNDGNDLLEGGEGADMIMGGNDRDTIVGGNDGDNVDGGTGSTAAGDVDDVDVLDLTGEGPFEVVGETTDADGNSTSGTINFLNADGTTSGTMTFTEIEEILGDRVIPNEDPDAEDDNGSGDEDTVITGNVLTNDTDPNAGDTLQVIGNSDPSNGTVTIDADGNYTYTPDDDFFGDDSFTYTVSDGNGGEDTATVNLTVAPVADAPEAEDDDGSTDEDTAIDIDVLANDSDPDGTDPTIVSFTQPDNGTVTDNGDGTLKYTPDDDYSGPDSFTYTITDGDPSTPDATATVNLTVDPTSDAPVVVDDTGSGDEDTDITGNVLTNDSDPDGDTLEVVDFTQPDNGTVTVDADGNYTYTPDDDFNGPDSFTYTVSDGDPSTPDVIGTVNLTVAPVADAPEAEDDDRSTDEDTAIDIDVLANDSDPDGTNPTIASFTQPDNGTVTDNGDGTLKYTPDDDYSGPDSFTYTITDGDPSTPDATATVNLTVDPTSDAPVVVDDTGAGDEDTDITGNVLTNDSDPDGDTLEVVDFTQPDNGTVTVDADGNYTYTPDDDFNGPDSFTYTVSDGDPSTPDVIGTVNLTVAPVNDDPDAEDDSDVTDFETTVSIDVLANDSDVDNPTADLTVTAISVPGDQGTLVETAPGVYDFTPANGFEGTATVSYTISDGVGGTDSAVHTIEVGADPTPQDGIVDGEETGEEMVLGYDDSNPIVDNGGDLITDGDDEIEGNGGDDTIDGAGGDDTISGGDDDDVITGGDGDDIVNGDDGADDLSGGEGDDTIDGGEGDDDIAVGGGDVASGGTGDDVFTIDDTDPATDIDATIDGGSDGTDGNPDGPENGDEGDVLDLGDQTDDLTVEFETNPEEGTVDGLDADGTPDLTFEEIEKVITGSGDDTVDGGDATGPIDVETGDGDDEVTGGDGDDTIDAGDGDDVVDGGDGDDEIEAGDGDDEVDGGEGDDTIEGGDGSDTLAGGEGSDSLVGGGDDDDIKVGAGDTAEGGSGDDEFTVDPALSGDDPITVIGGETGEDLTDPTNGGDGDTLDLRGLDLVSLVYDPTDPTFDPVTGVGESGTAVYNNDDGEPVTINFSEIEIVLNDPLPDGVVDGEEDGEDMQPDYDDGEQATDNGGDIIDGPDGDDDIINGNGGDDTINAGQGSDTVSGGTGDDSIIGGASDDGDDLSGDEGDDTIQGGGGDDTIDGGIGDDVVEGGTGDDEITGGDGNDSVDGGDGNDVIDTSGDEDLLDAGFPGYGPIPAIPADGDPDDDKDTVNGGAGNDTITTGDDADVIDGGTGDDIIDAGIDDDSVLGGAGNDLIIGSEGNDTLLGGGDDDTIFGGLETPAPDGVNLADDGFGAPFGPDPVTDNNNDLIDGGAGNDLIFGQDDDDTITGGTGNDTIDGGVDDDDISGGQGDDSLLGDHGDDSIQGNFGDDVLEGGRGNDTLEGNGDDDLILGGAGDSIIGGGDSDTIIIDQDEVDSDGENDTAIFVDGSGNGDDRDTLDLTDYLAHRNLVETPDGDGDSTSGTVEVQNDDLEWVEVTFAEIETLLLPPQAPDLIVDGEEFGEDMSPLYDDADGPNDGGGDIIDGPDGDDDSIRGNGGDDTINAGEGNDTVDGGDDNDSIQGGNGDDIIEGGEGDDTVRGEDGDDTVSGGAGNDSVTGGAGDDVLDGGEGDDSLTGGSGDDTIDGGIGNDTITGSTGADSITDLDGDNEINSDNPGSFNPDLGVPIGSPAGGFVVVAPDADPDDNKDTVTTGDGDDTITTGDDADVIDAGDGDNIVDGGTDADTITTGDGNDSIIGGEGDDLINSGDGDDTIDGGVGDPAANFIDEPNDGFFGDPILNNGDDTINAGAGNDVVNGEDDNDSIDGGEGDDTLDGGIDDDTILGGEGDDVIIGGQGEDSLDGGTGDDVFNVGTFTDPNGTGDYQEGVGDTIVGGEDADDNDIDTLDLTGSGSLEVVFDDAIDPTGTPGESGTVIFYTDDTQTEISGTLEFKEIENVIPCFTPGAMIATPRGEVPVETLRAGDKVITRDNGIQEICWTGNRTLNRTELSEGEGMKPILIKAGSLGRNLPERDMLVSPQHRVLVTGETPQLYFEESEVLVAAKHLVGKTGVSIMDTMRTTYIHFMFESHEVVLSDGAWTESFQPGDQTLGSMGEATREEIFALFPELATAEGLTDYAAARRTLKAHEAKLLRN